MKLATFVEQRWGTWGIFLIVLCSFVLTADALAYLLLLSTVAKVSTGQNYLLFVTASTILFGLGFAASTVGLWRRDNWGRLLFMGLIIIWAVARVGALFIYDSSVENIMVAAFYLVGGGAIVVYLRLPRIQAYFLPGEPAAIKIYAPSPEGEEAITKGS
jgi:hypothetical protein